MHNILNILFVNENYFKSQLDSKLRLLSYSKFMVFRPGRSNFFLGRTKMKGEIESFDSSKTYLEKKISLAYEELVNATQKSGSSSSLYEARSFTAI